MPCVKSLKLSAAAPQAADAPAASLTKVLMEHSGCGSNTQVDQLTVRLNPGDKVVMVMGKITAAIEQAAQPALTPGALDRAAKAHHAAIVAREEAQPAAQEPSPARKRKL